VSTDPAPAGFLSPGEATVAVVNRRPVSVALAALLALGGLVACSDSKPAATHPSSVSSSPPSSSASSAPATPSRSPSATPTSAPTSASPAPACPTSYAAPDPARPVVTLSFVVADDKASVRGHEQVAFTPDLPTGRLVFRLWANGPRPRQGGAHTEVSNVRVDGKPASFALSSGNTVVSVPLKATASTGTKVVADLDFALTLPHGINERLGHSGRTAWFGSGFPLLAWERGRGWATEPATSAFAEAATSEEFRLDLSVDTAPGDVVLGTGTPTRTAGRVRHRRAASVRDAMVAVGPFRTANARAGPTPVTVGSTPGLRDHPARLAAQHVAAIKAHEARYGPFPYASLDVAVVPDVHGGIEFPGGIILGTAQDQDATLVHEVAHEWFYGLVGDDQARDPWLDEAFATYAEALVRGTAGRYLSTSVPAAGRDRVGAPMTYWESRQSAYYRSVYVQGAAALLRARNTVGAARWDRAIRCYVAANAHTVATPGALRRALTGLPAAVAILRRAGAFPSG
jgi:hypothetical protein